MAFGPKCIGASQTSEPLDQIALPETRMPKPHEGDRITAEATQDTPSFDIVCLGIMVADALARTVRGLPERWYYYF